MVADLVVDFYLVVWVVAFGLGVGFGLGESGFYWEGGVVEGWVFFGGDEGLGLGGGFVFAVAAGHDNLISGKNGKLEIIG